MTSLGTSARDRARCELPCRGEIALLLIGLGEQRLEPCDQVPEAGLYSFRVVFRQQPDGFVQLVVRDVHCRGIRTDEVGVGQLLQLVACVDCRCEFGAHGVDSAARHLGLQLLLRALADATAEPVLVDHLLRVADRQVVLANLVVKLRGHYEPLLTRRRVGVLGQQHQELSEVSERILVMRCEQQYVDDRSVGAEFQGDVVGFPDRGLEARERGLVLSVIGAFPRPQVAHELLLRSGEIFRLALQRIQHSRESGWIGGLYPVGPLQQGGRFRGLKCRGRLRE